VPEQDSDPTFQGQVRLSSVGLRQKPALAQPVNNNGRRMVILEECKMTQLSQIAPMKITLQPRAQW